MLTSGIRRVRSYQTTMVYKRMNPSEGGKGSESVGNKSAVVGRREKTKKYSVGGNGTEGKNERVMKPFVC